MHLQLTLYAQGIESIGGILGLAPRLWGLATARGLPIHLRKPKTSQPYSLHFESTQKNPGKDLVVIDVIVAATLGSLFPSCLLPLHSQIILSLYPPSLKQVMIQVIQTNL